MVDKFHEELLPVAGQLTARLVESYMRLMRENLAQEANAPEELDALESNAGDDDKTFAAMGVAKTIATVSIQFARMISGLTPSSRLFNRLIAHRTFSRKWSKL